MFLLEGTVVPMASVVAKEAGPVFEAWQEFHHRKGKLLCEYTIMTVVLLRGMVFSVIGQILQSFEHQQH